MGMTSDAQNATRVITKCDSAFKNHFKRPQITQITPEVPKSVHLGHIFLLGLAKTVFLHCPVLHVSKCVEILKMILQVPACLLISKFWLDDIVGELMIDGKMQRSVC